MAVKVLATLTAALAMNELSAELPVDVLARRGVVHAMAATLLGHDIDCVKLESDEDGSDRCEVFRREPAVMPRWDGVVIEMAVKHLMVGCAPCAAEQLPQECVRCMAETALRHAVQSESRMYSQDACEDAYQLVVGREQVVTELTRELLLRGEISGQQVARLLWPTGDPVNGARYRF